VIVLVAALFAFYYEFLLIFRRAWSRWSTWIAWTRFFR